MTTRELERRLQGLGITRREARVLIERGKRWRWLALVSVALFAHFTVWRIR